MRKTLYDIGVCAAIIGASGLIYWDALKYRPGRYDPLGSGTMPQMVAVGIIVLCLVAIIQALVTRPLPPKRLSPEEAEAENFERRPWLALLIFGYAILCSILLYLRIPFGISASLMLFASILAIKRHQRSIIVPAALCSVAFGFGLTYLFGSVFGVDLP